MEEYTVQEGDTFSSISEKFYGDTEHAQALWEVNQHVGGVGPTPDDLNYEHDGKSVILTIPD